jgi:hypothetical protein
LNFWTCPLPNLGENGVKNDRRKAQFLVKTPIPVPEHPETWPTAMICLLESNADAMTEKFPLYVVAEAVSLER